MTANDVYNIANALPKDELVRLCDMLEIKIQPKKHPKRKTKSLPDFTVKEGIQYLIKMHFNKVKTP